MNNQEYRNFILQAFRKKTDIDDVTWKDLGLSFDITEESARKKFNWFCKKNKIDVEEFTESDIDSFFTDDDTEPLSDKTDNKIQFDEKKDNLSINGNISSKSTDRVKILSEFLSLCEVDEEEWEVDRYVLNAWDVTMSGEKSSTQEDSTYTNYQIKVWLKKRIDFFDKYRFMRELIEDVKKEHKPDIKPLNKITLLDDDDKNLFVPLFFDVHVGRVYFENHNDPLGKSVMECQNIVMESLYRMINEIKHKKIDTILFVMGQDFINFDTGNPFPQTTKGTPMETDIMYQNMIRTSRIMMYTMIDTLLEIAPVKIMSVAGNHEKQTTWLLMELLKAKYEDNKNVEIDNSHHERKYFKYGNNLIMSTHGESIKEAEIHQLMSIDNPKYWSDCDYKYAYLGHWHYDRCMKSKSPKNIVLGQDYKGVNIEFVRSMAKTDMYEHSKGYVGTVKGAKAMIHNYVHGRTHKIGINI